MADFLELTDNFEKSVSQLNEILQGDENTTVEINGVQKPSIEKKTKDTVDSKVQFVLDAAADIDAVKYASTAAGISATSSGQFFTVVSGNDASFLDLYENQGGSAVFKKSYPSQAALKNSELVGTSSWVGKTSEVMSSYPRCYDLINAIETIETVNVPTDTTYYISIFMKDDPTYKYRFFIRNDNGDSWTLDGDILPADQDPTAGPVTIKITRSNSYFLVTLDYRKLDSTFFYSTLTPYITINPSLIKSSNRSTDIVRAAHSPYGVFEQTTAIDPNHALHSEILKVFSGVFFNTEKIMGTYKLKQLLRPTATTVRIHITDDEGKDYDSGTVTTANNAIVRCKGENSADFIDVKVNLNALTKIGTYYSSTESIFTFANQEDSSHVVKALKKLQLNTAIDTSISDISKESAQSLSDAIKGCKITGNATKVGINSMSINHQTYKYDLWITDGTGLIAKFTGVPSVDDVTGYSYLKCYPQNNSGVTVELLIDYTLLPNNVVYINNSDAATYIWLNKAPFGTYQMKEIADYNLRVTESPVWAKKTVFLNKTAYALKNAVKAIVDIDIRNVDVTKSYTVAVLTKNDQTYDTRLVISIDGVLKGYSILSAPNADGLTEMKATSGELDFTAWVDFRQLEDGVLINGANNSIIIDPNYISPRRSLDLPEIDLPPVMPVKDNIRLSAMGSSITWGSGYVGQYSYLGSFEKYLRETLSTTFVGRDLNTNVTMNVFETEHACYSSVISKIDGVGAYIEGEMYCNEVSIALAKERGNANACIVALYIDDVLHDTFDTLNAEYYEENKTLNFAGNGEDLLYSLNSAFTFNHVVTVDNVELTGGIYNGGYGGTMPASWDYMILRKTDTVNGEVKVSHFIQFKNAPANSSSIAVTFDVGETIKEGKTTIGNISKGIGSGLESSYGSGGTSYDPANPVGLSSGLDFRQTDDRAISTWRFDTYAKRKFKFVITELHSLATSLTPSLFFSYVTNRAHFIQNAGIGGFKASNFLSASTLTNLKHVKRFRPNVAYLESGTNDDWVVSTFKAYKTQSGITRQQLEDGISSIHMNALAGSDDNFTVESSFVNAFEVNPFSIKLEPDATYDNIEKGDVITIGEYGLDIRRTATRVVDSWDSVNKVVTFTKELLPSDFIQFESLDDVVGSPCQIRTIDPWVDNVRSVMNDLTENLDDANVYIATCGVPFLNTRRLAGYKEKALALSKELKLPFIDFYDETLKWQYNQPASTALYLNSSKSTVSTGISEYELKKEDGSSVMEYAPQNIKVYVNGVERLRNMTLKGGVKKSWDNSIAIPTLSNANWIYTPLTLLFTDDIPPVGATIEVFINFDKWAADNCHPQSIGYNLLAEALIKKMVG
ncbi:hypothetical protein ACSFVZ_18880 [Pseudoalteromonas sp. SYSU M81236]|uniref:hypothetical protein n=1 Tax=Pseudoalteromonas sp. SYSU M81236 TaxID=3447014 RepID=UPI003F0B0116